MKLITKEIEAAAPRPSHEEHKVPIGQRIAVAKFFDPTGRYTFWMTEYNPTDRIAFGYCLSPLDESCDELGYVSIAELEAVEGAFGLGIERDRHFDPKPLSEAVNEFLGHVPSVLANR